MQSKGGTHKKGEDEAAWQEATHNGFEVKIPRADVGGYDNVYLVTNNRTLVIHYP